MSGENAPVIVGELLVHELKRLRRFVDFFFSVLLCGVYLNTLDLFTAHRIKYCSDSVHFES